jgi:hypothetical protein
MVTKSLDSRRNILHIECQVTYVHSVNLYLITDSAKHVLVKCLDMRTRGISCLFMLNPHLSPSVDSQVPATRNKLLLESPTRLVTSYGDERLICCTNTRQWKHAGRAEEKCTRVLCSQMDNAHWNTKANHFFPSCILDIVFFTVSFSFTLPHFALKQWTTLTFLFSCHS